MTIAVIDAGFHNADRIEAMKNIRILGTRDFVNPEADIYAESNHGMSVLSCMAMNQPNVMVGTAPEAPTGCFAVRMRLPNTWWSRIIGLLP